MATKHYLSFLQETMNTHWDRLAMKDLDGVNSYTYAELASEIEKLHVTWRELGIKEGDKIALCGRNCANWGLLFLAVETYKAVVVSILPDFTAEGIYSLVDHSEAILLYVGPNVKKKIDTTQMKGLKATLFKSLSLQLLPSQHQLGSHLIFKLGSDVESLGFGEFVTGVFTNSAIRLDYLSG